MDTKAVKKFEEVVAVVFAVLGLMFVCWVLVMATKKTISYNEMLERRQVREAQWHEEWKKEKGCVHTGYYGRYGGQRTYNCKGTVLVEEGIRMYDKERGVYVKNW